jgi:hypothetical protein
MLPNVTGRDFALKGSTSTLPSQVAIAVAREWPCVRSHCGHWLQWHGLPLLLHLQLPTRLHNGGGGAELAGPTDPLRSSGSRDIRQALRNFFRSRAFSPSKPERGTAAKAASSNGCHLPCRPPYAVPFPLPHVLPLP